MMKQGIWTQEEHDRFLDAIKIYPQGPWRAISKFVGSRSVRQVQTHAQKYHEKIQRRMRGMHKDRKTWARTEHRIDSELLESCRRSEGLGVPTLSVLQRAPLNVAVDNDVGFEELLKQASGIKTPCSPAGVDAIDPLDLSTKLYEDIAVKLEPMVDALNIVDELPSLSESLDFLIECFSD